MGSVDDRLHPEAREFLRLREEKGLAPKSEGVSWTEMRELNERMQATFREHVEFDGDITDFDVHRGGDGVKESLTITVFKPKTVAPRPTILVYFHGGGWTIGSKDVSADTCKRIASRLDCILVNGDYRKAPEHLWPACLEDTIDIMNWVISHKSDIGGVSDSTIGVGGDSAGGHLAACVCHEIPGIDYQVLIYPKVDCENTRKSYEEFENGPIMSKADIPRYMEDLFGSTESVTDVRCCPIKRASFEGLPSALIIVAECDCMRDDGIDYEAKLRESGVETKLLIVKNACHSFFHMTVFKECSRQARDAIAEFVQQYA